MASLVLKFFQYENSLTLEETSFFSPESGEVIRGIRGKRFLPGQFRRFHWSDSLHALCILAIRHRLFGGSGRPPQLFVGATLLGEGQSPASTLDYALTKQPNWMKDLFGCTPTGDSILRTLIGRMNPERKRPGPVRLWFEARAIDPAHIRIFLNEIEITSPALLEESMNLLELSWSSRARTRGRRGNAPSQLNL